eukprot:jgi/Mesvir1/3928/Mv19867-RA.2
MMLSMQLLAGPLDLSLPWSPATGLAVTARTGQLIKSRPISLNAAPSRWRGRTLCYFLSQQPHKRFPVAKADTEQAERVTDGGWETFQNWIDQLKDYRTQWGHTNVVLGNPLGKWVYAQRRLKKQGKLDDARVAALDAIGFEWEHPYELFLDDAGWEQMFADLLEFKAAHGHTMVKKKHEPHPALGYWVNEQRIAGRENRLSDERRARLDAVGFSWVAEKQCGSTFMVGFRELCAFRDAHGHLQVPKDEPLARWVVRMARTVALL